MGNCIDTVPELSVRLKPLFPITSNVRTSGADRAMDTMRNGGGFLVHPIPVGERRFEVGDCQRDFRELIGFNVHRSYLCDGWLVDVTDFLG